MVEVRFHDIGEGMTEGEVVNYLVAIGDNVKVDEPLVELQTDKMVAELPSPAAGTIKKIYIEEGTVVPVGTVLIEIEGVGGNVDAGSNDQESDANLTADERVQTASSTALQESAVVVAKKQQSVGKQTPKRILAAPYTRKIARENNIDIEKITGSGPGGRVTEEDVFAFKESDQIVASPQNMEGMQAEAHTTIPFTGMRKKIADKMTQSLSTIPHVTHFDDVDVTNLSDIRKRLKESGESVSVAAFFVKALALTLRDFPIFNGELDEENDVIHLYKHFHIGIATDTERGLLVPVLEHVEKKNIRTIHTEMKALTKKAQAGELKAHEMQDGTFTMSNVGPLGGTAATPIINYPQTSIIAFHKTKKVPVVMNDDEIAIRSIMTMSLSFDHRVADGAMAVRFTNRFKEWIENPETLLLELM